ncbi:MAG TPA: lactonase family protein [Verrucomicrobiae bacterium]|nr:lactonase family protein [Verrucomicrobiae bacterium]
MRIFLVLCSVMTGLLNSAQADYLVYVGTYTGAKSKGIYALRMDKQGKLAPLGLVAETPSPSFLAIHPNKKFLYAVNEKDNGTVTGFSIDGKTGKLTQINEQPSHGAGPCHVSLDKTGKTVLVANYNSGSIAAYPVRRDGSLGDAATKIQHEGGSADPRRQKGPHAHFITPDPANRYALVCDLGLDKVLVYRLDAAKASLTPNDPPFGVVKPASGPRHLAFHPKGRFVYVNNEMNSTLTVFNWDKSRGALEELQTVSTLSGEVRGNSTAEIEVHPSGKFVYVSNRGHDSIACYSIDEKNGRVALIEHQSSGGKTPRNFAIDPKGEFLLTENQGSDSVVVFRIDANTGRLMPTGERAEVGAPVCMKFVAMK